MGRPYQTQPPACTVVQEKMLEHMALSYRRLRIPALRLLCLSVLCRIPVSGRKSTPETKNLARSREQRLHQPQRPEPVETLGACHWLFGDAAWTWLVTSKSSTNGFFGRWKLGTVPSTIDFRSPHWLRSHRTDQLLQSYYVCLSALQGVR
jgi:hypothetical protein